MKVLCCQLHIENVTTRDAMEHHQTRIEELVRQAAAREPFDLLLLPELSAIDYSLTAFENLAELANPHDGWLTERMGQLARDVNAYVCFGGPLINDRKHSIAQWVVDRGGHLVGHYKKVHLAQFGASAEKPYFASGDHILVFDVDDFRFGVVICYDMRFGQYISKIVDERQIHIMLHPVAFSQDGSFASWRSFVCTRALENNIYWLSINRAGEGWGHSVFCPPWFESESEVVSLGETEELHRVELDHERLQYAKETYPIGYDRLSDYTRLETHVVDHVVPPDR